MSHVITFPSGKVGETFDKETVETARRMGLKVETIHEYLGRINSEIADLNFAPTPHGRSLSTADVAAAE